MRRIVRNFVSCDLIMLFGICSLLIMKFFITCKVSSIHTAIDEVFIIVDIVSLAVSHQVNYTNQGLLRVSYTRLRRLL